MHQIDTFPLNILSRGFTKRILKQKYALYWVFCIIIDREEFGLNILGLAQHGYRCEYSHYSFHICSNSNSSVCWNRNYINNPVLATMNDNVAVGQSTKSGGCRQGLRGIISVWKRELLGKTFTTRLTGTRARTKTQPLFYMEYDHTSMPYHNEAEEKRSPFSRRHFSMHFLEWKCFNSDLKCHRRLFFRVQFTIYQHWFR